MNARAILRKTLRISAAVTALLVAFSWLTTEPKPGESIPVRLLRGLGINPTVAMVVFSSAAIGGAYMLCLAWPNFVVVKPEKNDGDDKPAA